MGKIYLVTVGECGTDNYRIAAACTSEKEAHKFWERFAGDPFFGCSSTHIEERDDGICTDLSVYRVMFHKVEGGFEYESCSERFREDAYSFSHLNRPLEFSSCWSVVVEAADKVEAQRIARDILVEHLSHI